MRYVIQAGRRGIRYADEPMFGELSLEEMPEELMQLAKKAEPVYWTNIRIPTESRAYRYKMSDGSGIVINVQAMRGKNQLRRHPCT